MTNAFNIKFYAVTMDCDDLDKLAGFYAKLLGWVVAYQDAEYACLAVPGAKQGEYPGITLQYNPDYAPPVWPEEPGKQQQMAHLDLAVSDQKKAVELAISLGATIAAQQFNDGWTVMLDPAGHPFCLVDMPGMLGSGDCHLR